MQRLFLLKITRSYRTTSNQALMVLDAVPPLDLTAEKEGFLPRILRLQRDAELWSCHFSAIDFEHRPSKPLCHPAEFDLPDSIFTFSQQLLPNFIIEIYTDGSRSPTGTGCGLCLYVNGALTRTWRRRLNTKNSVYQAELVAIKKAIDLASKLTARTIIYTDSKSSLEALQNMHPTSSLVHIMQRLLLQLPSNHRPILQWVPGHSGVWGNEHADSIAKEADQGVHLVEYPIAYPASYLKSIAIAKLL
ncbi:ribonuclease H-like [Stegodyphus dumicola]|uniref:ribonuclease H-like n=1 Tax=Stegodyphus dumicola TaxID=202533 RepID=UPI0015AE23F1|nr:ribonuclease H-like [Stegodyphus dumicola]